MGKRTAQTQRVTRRTLLGGAAAAGAASLIRPKAGFAAAMLRQTSVFVTSVGSLAGESAPLRAARAFALVGIEWSGPRAATIELRTQAPNGRWSPWVRVSGLGHNGDAQAPAGRLFGEPVWSGSATAVQLRSDRHVAGLRVHFVAANPLGPAASEAALVQATPVLDAGPGQPPIIARGAWAAGAARPRHQPIYGTVKLAFVHHTVNPNGYSPGEVPAMLRAIFDYHVYVRGFWDIAYNFLIDAYGRVWEGRAGGLDMPVIGAHAGAYNAQSTGIAMLGDFMNVAPAPAAMNALKQLLAWKLSLHGLPATGRTTVVVDPADAFYTPFRPGAHVSLPLIAGHRDGDLTDCPGNALYARLPALRPRVSALAGTPARIAVPTQSVLVAAGSAATLSGTLELLSGEPLGGAPIELQVLGPSGPPASTFQTLTTAADGSWTTSVSFERTTLVRALHRPYPASVGDWIQVAVAPVLTLTAQSLSPLVLTGTVSPPKARVTVALYRAGPVLKKPVSHRRVRTVGGSFTATLSVPGPGDYVAIARTAADASNAAAASPLLPLTIG